MSQRGVDPPRPPPGQVEAAMAAVCFYGVRILPLLRAMPPRWRRKLLRRAGRLNCTVPLHLDPGPYRFREWPWGELSGLEVVTVMVFGLWVEQGERPELCGTLIAHWPIAEVVFLVNGEPLRPPTTPGAGE